MKKGLFGDQSIKKRLLLSCIIVTIIPMIILLVFFSLRLKDSQYEQQIGNANSLADKLIQNYSLEIEKAELMAGSLAEFDTLQTYLNTTFGSYREEFDYYQTNVHPMVAGFNNSKGSARVRIYHNKKIPNYSLEVNNGLDAFIAKYFTTNPFIKESSFWTHIDGYSFHPALSYFRTAQSRTNNYDTAYVVSVHLKEKAFYSYIENEPPEQMLILLFDDSGNILTSNAQDLRGKRLSDLPLGNGDAKMLFQKPEVFLGGEKYFVTTRSAGILRLAILVSDENLRDNLLRSVSSIVAIGLALLALSTLLLFYSTGRVTKGINLLMEKMSGVTRDRIHNMAKDATIENSRDEIVQLDSMFTKMMQQIDDLVDQVKSDEIRIRDEVINRQQAELTYLQQQINPHYLFNTLEAIRMNLIIKNDYENASIIKMFADSFRRYMDTGNKETTLLEELSFVDKYIAIQNYRLGNKIRYNLDAKESLMNVRILKLLIQPLIENSVTHGLEDLQEGRIDVSVHRDDRHLIITVADSGVGMTAEKLEELRNYVYRKDTERAVGLQNVYKRLKLYYGDNADLIIESEQHKGSTVTILIPVEKRADV